MVFLDTARAKKKKKADEVRETVSMHACVWDMIVPIHPIKSQQGGCDLVELEVNLTG